MARLFISQDRLDTWTAEGRVRIEGSTMTLLDNNRSFTIVSAVRFLNVSGDDPDKAELVGKVKDEQALVELGADQYMNSVIVADTAYDVQPGFLGTAIPRG